MKARETSAAFLSGETVFQKSSRQQVLLLVLGQHYTDELPRFVPKSCAHRRRVEHSVPITHALRGIR
jgi:hypothetical protein